MDEELIDYINEQKEIERSIDEYSSGEKYDFAIELVESFFEGKEDSNGQEKIQD